MLDCSTLHRAMRMDQRILLGLAFALSCTACTDATLPEPTTSEAVRPTCPAKTSDDYFIPAESFGPNRETDAFVRQGPTRVLSEAGESSLSCGASSSVESYRLVWIHSMVPRQPLVAHVSRVGSNWKIAGLGSSGGPSAAKIERRERVLSHDEASELVRSVKNAEFWSTSAWFPGPPVSDGGIWIIEGRRDDVYHVVRRWGLSAGSLFTLGVTLARLTSLPLPALMNSGFGVRN